MAHLAEKNKVFYVVSRNRWIKVGKVSKTLAKKFLAKTNDDEAFERMGEINPNNIKFYKFADEYLGREKTVIDVGTYKIKVNAIKLLKDFIGDIYLSRITTTKIEDFKNERKFKYCFKGQKENSNRTVNMDLNVLRHMLGKAMKWKYLTKNPMDYVENLKEPIRLPKYLSLEQLKHLLACATNHVRIFVLIAYYTGMRVGEISKMKFIHLNFNKKTISIPDTKTDMPRIIPMGGLEELLEWLVRFRVNPITGEKEPRHILQMDYVFCNKDGSRMKCFRTGFVKARRKANLNDFSIHHLRKTYASHLYELGVPYLTISKLLGHASQSTTEIYVGLSNPTILNQAASLLGDRMTIKIDELFNKDINPKLES